MDLSDNLPARPLTIKEIAARAEDYTWNPAIKLKYYLRAAGLILSEARSSNDEGNYENAYMLFTRHCSLVLRDLSQHPEAKDPANKNDIRKLAKGVPAIMDEMQTIRPHIENAYKEWAKIQASQQDSKSSLSGSRHGYSRESTKDSGSSWSSAARAKVLDAGEHQDLAVELAQKELRRREARRKARRESMTEQEEHERRTGGVWDDWDSQLHPAFGDSRELQKQMEKTRRALDHRDRRSLEEDSQDPRQFSIPNDTLAVRCPTSSSASYSYPLIAPSATISYDAKPSRPRMEPPRPQPPRPAKILDPPPKYEKTPPPVPEKSYLHSYEPVVSQAAYENREAPMRPPKEPEATVQPARPVTFAPAAYLENKDPLRPIFLPSQLRERFLRVAADNTQKGLEMCGILCGTLVNGALFISVLLIPEQKCTTDTCETENESAMLDYCINHDLLIVGWIHTHPTQTCFMSSRDLHTQAGYQVMMPESIAIVCAPRHEPSWGIFRLTHPPGLNHILQCAQSDTFHQHSIENIYTDAIHPPGHVYETSRLAFKVEDLRPGFRKGFSV